MTWPADREYFNWKILSNGGKGQKEAWSESMPCKREALSSTLKKKLRRRANIEAEPNQTMKKFWKPTKLKVSLWNKSQTQQT